MKSLIACKVNTFSRDKQEKILLYVYAFRSNMSKSVLSLAMAYIVSFHFEFCKGKRDMSGHIPLSLLYINNFKVILDHFLFSTVQGLSHIAQTPP